MSHPAPTLTGMDIPSHLRAGCESYPDLGRWHRAKLGRALRRLGLSYGEIMSLIPVPKGTLAGWCREIRLTENQGARIQRRNGSQLGVPRNTQRKRHEEIGRIVHEAMLFASNHLDDPFWVAGTVLYWGEGSKAVRRLELTNADPRTLRLFMSWTRRYLDDQPKFVASLNLHADNNELNARRSWASELGLKLTDFNKSFIKPEGTGHRKNHLPNGVCRLGLRKSTDHFLKTMAWIEVLAQNWAPAKAGALTSSAGR